jgi:hypothetical protein
MNETELKEKWMKRAHVAELEVVRLENEVEHLRRQRDDLQARNTELVEARRALEQKLA